MRQLGILAKYWLPGRVKTRLAAAVGVQRASRLHRLFLECSLSRLATVGDRRLLGFTPADRQSEFQQLAGPDWVLQPQGDGDLGARMQRYFAAAFRAGARRVVLLGADTPSLPLDIVFQAFDLLLRQPVVLGPSDDGGYYLLGAAGEVPPIFDRVDWGTPRVWAQTVARLVEAGLKPAELPAWYDVDRPDDLARLQAELAATDAADPDLVRLRGNLQQIVSQPW